MNTTTATANKYVACLVEAADKAYLVELRENAKMTEKGLLAKIVAIAKQFEADIIADGLAAAEAYENEKATKAVERYEESKRLGKEVRALARIQREHLKAKPAATTEVAAAETVTEITATPEPSVISETETETVGDIA